MKAYELLADKSKWTQHAFARDAQGEECSSISSTAVCWCAIGAINRCYPTDGARLNAKAKARDHEHQREGSLSVVNDIDGYDAIMDVLRRADV